MDKTEKRHRYIAIVVTIMIITTVFTYIVFIQSKPTGERWPYIKGDLEPNKLKNKTNTIIFSINITQKSSDSISIYHSSGETRIDVKLVIDNSTLNKTEYKWTYVDSNENERIDSSDKLSVTISDRLKGERIEIYMYVEDYMTAMSGEFKNISQSG